MLFAQVKTQEELHLIERVLFAFLDKHLNITPKANKRKQILAHYCGFDSYNHAKPVFDALPSVGEERQRTIPELVFAANQSERNEFAVTNHLFKFLREELSLDIKDPMKKSELQIAFFSIYLDLPPLDHNQKNSKQDKGSKPQAKVDGNSSRSLHEIHSVDEAILKLNDDKQAFLMLSELVTFLKSMSPSERTHYDGLDEWSKEVNGYIRTNLYASGFVNGDKELNDSNPLASFWFSLYTLLSSITYSRFLKTEVDYHHSSAKERNDAFIAEIEDVMKCCQLAKPTVESQDESDWALYKVKGVDKSIKALNDDKLVYALLTHLITFLKSLSPSDRTHYHKLEDWCDVVDAYMSDRLKESGFVNADKAHNESIPLVMFWWSVDTLLSDIIHSKHLKSSTSNHHSSAKERNNAFIAELEDVLKLVSNNTDEVVTKTGKDVQGASEAQETASNGVTDVDVENNPYNLHDYQLKSVEDVMARMEAKGGFENGELGLLHVAGRSGSGMGELESLYSKSTMSSDDKPMIVHPKEGVVGAFDNLTKGLYPSELVVLSGRPNVGKTKLFHSDSQDVENALELGKFIPSHRNVVENHNVLSEDGNILLLGDGDYPKMSSLFKKHDRVVAINSTMNIGFPQIPLIALSALQADGVDKLVIVCPKSLVMNFKKTFKERLDIDDVEVLLSKSSFNGFKSKVTVVSSELFTLLELGGVDTMGVAFIVDYYPSRMSTETRTHKIMLEQMSEFQMGVVLIDSMPCLVKSLMKNGDKQLPTETPIEWIARRIKGVFF